MKKLFAIILTITTLSASADILTPFEFWARDAAGAGVTNRVTITPWPATNYIIAVGTNLVVQGATDYYPTTNGYVFGYLAPNNYKLNIQGFTLGITFGITASASTQNVAQLAGVPVTEFMNFTLAQFSDAGGMAYSNTAAYGTLVTNTAKWYSHLYNTNIPLANVTNSGTLAYSNTAAYGTLMTNTASAYGAAAVAAAAASYQPATATLSNVNSGASNLYVGAFTGNGVNLTNVGHYGCATMSTGAVASAASAGPNVFASWSYLTTGGGIGTATNTALVVTNAGKYIVSFGGDILSGNSDICALQCFTNGVICPVVNLKATMAASAVTASGFKEFLITLPANTYVYLVTTNSDTSAQTLENACLNIKSAK